MEVTRWAAEREKNEPKPKGQRDWEAKVAAKALADVGREVLREEGVLGLWKGVVPAAIRASVLTASQCVTYDVVKHFLMNSMTDNALVNAIAGGPPGSCSPGRRTSR